MINTGTDKNLVNADIFRILSLGFSYPSAENLSSVKEISQEIISHELAEIQIVEQLIKISSQISQEEILKEYSRLFLKKTVPNTESFCSSSLNAIADVAGFYKAFGTNPKSGDAPDALPYELEFMALLLVKLTLAETEEQKQITFSAYKKFLNEHLIDFARKFSRKMKEADCSPFYLELIVLLEMFLDKE